jgi:purine-binding chemotaxis protein CheW
MTTPELNSRTALLQADAGKYLTFLLGPESYGISVLVVREIIRPSAITAVPRMPAEIKGVINLRGRVVPIIALRTMFDLADATSDAESCIIVVQVKSASRTGALVGLLVDAAEEVLHLASGDIEPPPNFGSALDAKHIAGMAKAHGRVKTLLNLDRLLARMAEETVDSLSHS